MSAAIHKEEDKTNKTGKGNSTKLPYDQDTALRQKHRENVPKVGLLGAPSNGRLVDVQNSRSKRRIADGEDRLRSTALVNAVPALLHANKVKQSSDGLSHVQRGQHEFHDGVF